ncbi:HU family DNA-binding protein [uncultured Metabacillus sp.]|uniref:HU family DNA-binding protein n=1 Tax=uncultured Metabacillus sp. TaxID=2860135 RepID=UPI002610F529|nr:HU family DNA-binding protein [uncultured Metabacillus sp.]
MANKTDLVKAVQGLVEEALSEKEISVNKKEATAIVDAVLDSIVDLTNEQDKLQIVGFGNFEARTRKARKGHNPQDPTVEIEIPEKRVPAFKPGKTFKETVSL